MKYTKEAFEEHTILSKFKESDNKDLGFWFIVPGSWLKEKPETTNQRPGNQIFIEIGQKEMLCKGLEKE